MLLKKNNQNLGGNRATELKFSNNNQSQRDLFVLTRIAVFYLTHHTFYPLIATFNAVERPLNTLVPIIMYAIVAINSKVIPSPGSLVISLEIDKTEIITCHFTKKPLEYLEDVIKLQL